MKILSSGAVLCAVLLLPACSLTGTNQASNLVIRGGTSFGFCAGYCNTELTLNPNEIVLIETSLNADTHPDRRYEERMKPEQWQRLVQLIDVANFSELEPVYGCPDCADGGAEWIEIEQGKQRNRVTFEYNASLDPIAALADEIRQIRSRLKPGEQ